MRVSASKTVLVAVAICYLFFLYLFLFGDVSKDFIEFFSASAALRTQKNPYDAAVLLSLQQSIAGAGRDIALMYWSPPWLLPFMGSIFWGEDFLEALQLWKLLSIMGISLSLAVLMVLIEKTKADYKKVAVLLFCVLSAPFFLDTARLGQSTPVFLLAMVLFVYGWFRGLPFLRGITAALFICKPHLFFLPGVLWLIEEKRRGDFGRVAGGVCISLVSMIMVSELQYPGGSKVWLETFMFQEMSGDTVPRASWITATLPGIMRTVFSFDSPILSVIVPGITVTSLLWLQISQRITIRFPSDITWLVPLGLLTAPYGWTYDHALCVVSIWCMGMILMQDMHYFRIIGLLCLWNLSALVYYLQFARYQHELWWYPIGPLAAGLYLRICRSRESFQPSGSTGFVR